MFGFISIVRWMWELCHHVSFLYQFLDKLVGFNHLLWGRIFMALIREKKKLRGCFGELWNCPTQLWHQDQNFHFSFLIFFLGKVWQRLSGACFYSKFKTPKQTLMGLAALDRVVWSACGDNQIPVIRDSLNYIIQLNYTCICMIQSLLTHLIFLNHIKTLSKL